MNATLYMNDGADAGERIGSLEDLMKAAAQGRLSKSTLASLLDTQHRQAFLDACAVIERKYTEECATHDPCLEAGCAVEGEICLQPLLRAGVEYQRACAAEWIKLFANPRNRSGAWKK